MAKKKKKGKVIQMLSPEKYVQQKARTLPIHECWVNDTWEEDGIAYITISRKHTNNNITLGNFLVDTKCLGLKDTFTLFNIPQFEYRKFLEKIEENMDLIKVPYTLVHNIIFAAIEFAEEYGFKPHPDFRITKYILEEDNDDVELIDIECGVDGKPFYLRGPLEDDLMAGLIIAQLEETAGPGNYGVVDGLDEEFLNDEILDEDFPFDEEDISQSVTYQFKIQIKNITNPPVWRRLTIPSYYRFSDFHDVIQIAFGWENAHLFQFSPKGYGSFPVIKEADDDDFGGYGDRLEAEETLLSDIFFEEKQKFTYIYDFGDDWTHTITLEKIIHEVAMTPILLAGKGKCPPEDCGGAWGYGNLKEILSDPENPEYEEFLEWLNTDVLDPGEFDIEEQRKLLIEVFPEKKKDN